MYQGPPLPEWKTPQILHFNEKEKICSAEWRMQLTYSRDMGVSGGCVYGCENMSVCVFLSQYDCISVWVFVCVCLSLCLCLGISVWVCVCVLVYACVCVCKSTLGEGPAIQPNTKWYLGWRVGCSYLNSHRDFWSLSTERKYQKAIRVHENERFVKVSRICSSVQKRSIALLFW